MLLVFVSGYLVAKRLEFFSFFAAKQQIKHPCAKSLLAKSMKDRTHKKGVCMNMDANTNGTINQASRENFRFFLPDFVNQEIEELQPFTIEELLPFGKANLEEMRKYHRKAEKKLTEVVQASLNMSVSNLNSVSSVEELSSMLSFYDIAVTPPAIVRSWKANGGRHTVMCDWKSHGEECLDCRYGKFVAMWCEMNTQKTFSYSPFVRPQEQIDEVAIQQEYPYANVPCLLTTEEKLSACKEFLATKATEVRERIKLVRQRIDRLTAAIDLANEKPRFTVYRDAQSWVQIGETVIALCEQPADAGSEFRKALVADTKFNLPPIFRFNTILVLFPKNAITFQVFDPTILRPEEFDYLRKNEEYLDLWLGWSLHQEAANADLKDKLKKLFREYVG